MSLASKHTWLQGYLTAFPCLLMSASALTAAYWMCFFLIPGFRDADDPTYLTFEYSCVAPDAAMAGAMLLGGLGMRGGEAKRGFLAVAGCGAMVYLGLLDVSFNVQRLAGGTSYSVIELIINSFCMAFGVSGVIAGKHAMCRGRAHTATNQGHH